MTPEMKPANGPETTAADATAAIAAQVPPEEQPETGTRDRETEALRASSPASPRAEHKSEAAPEEA